MRFLIRLRLASSRRLADSSSIQLLLSFREVGEVTSPNRAYRTLGLVASATTILAVRRSNGAQVEIMWFGRHGCEACDELG